MSFLTKTIAVLSVFAGLLCGAKVQSQTMINIDNPAFRKLVIAVPKFQAAGPISSPVGKKFVDEGAQELVRLLQFSGFFAALAETAYQPAWEQFAKARKTHETTAWILDKGLSGEEVVQWRALGVESLTMAALSEDAQKGLTLSLKTFDINRSKEIIAKQFTRITDYKATLRQYADYLLQAYTGKSGIFNSKIAIVGRRSKAANKQIFLVDFDGSNLTQITDGEFPHLSPSWSADGRYLAYTSYESKNPDIYLYDTVTRTKRRITHSSGLDSGANFAPNGKLVAHTSSRGDDTDIFTITPAGTERKLLLEGSGLDVDPKFSPDGKWLAWVSGRFGNPHIFVAALSWNGDQPKITGDKRLTFSGWYNATPAWTPESDKIAFGGYDKDIDRWDIFIMNPDGTQLERLTLKSGDSESPSFSPNGQLIVFQSNRIGDSNAKGLSTLWIMNRDGSNQHRLELTGLYDCQTPAWSPNKKLD